MKQQYYGQLDLTKLGKIARQHSGLVKKVQFKDGEHQLIDIKVFLKDEPDRFGNVATIKASCKQDEEVQGVNYFVSDLKESDNKKKQHGNQREEDMSNYSDVLPF